MFSLQLCDYAVLCGQPPVMLRHEHDIWIDRARFAIGLPFGWPSEDRWAEVAGSMEVQVSDLAPSCDRDIPSDLPGYSVDVQYMLMELLFRVSQIG